jgi:thiol:disulfide interchange protein
MDSPKPNFSSFFETEAKRIAELNKHKNAVPATQSFAALIGKLLAMAFGGGIGVIIMLCLMLPLTAYSILAHGYVGMKLWQWFVVPTFHVGTITWLQAGGIMLLLRLFTYEKTTQDNLEGKTTKEKICHTVGILLIPWYSLLVGWLAHFLM